MINYDIAVLYDIPGNGKLQLIDLNNYNINADFKYYSAPKLSDEKYIVATLSDFEKYNPLPGEANVTFNDTYVGKTKLRPNCCFGKDGLNVRHGMGRYKKTSDVLFDCGFVTLILRQR